MGVWGTGLFQSDHSLDFRGDFYERLRQLKSEEIQDISVVESITHELIDTLGRYNKADITIIGTLLFISVTDKITPSLRERCLKATEYEDNGWFDPKDKIERRKIVQEFKKKVLATPVVNV